MCASSAQLRRRLIGNRYCRAPSAPVRPNAQTTVVCERHVVDPRTVLANGERARLELESSRDPVHELVVLAERGR